MEAGRTNLKRRITSTGQVSDCLACDGCSRCCEGDRLMETQARVSAKTELFTAQMGILGVLGELRTRPVCQVVASRIVKFLGILLIIAVRVHILFKFSSNLTSLHQMR